MPGAELPGDPAIQGVDRQSAMIEIKVIMNSSVEEVLSFKCCNLHGQNMEILLKNLGEEPLTVHGSCELLDNGQQERLRVDYLFPPGPYTLLPGEPLACYCSMADEVFNRYAWIVFRDTRGNEHRSSLPRLESR